MSSRRGQFLLLGVLILAICLLAALSLARTPNPRLISSHDWIYSAELVHAARLGIVKYTKIGGDLGEHIGYFLRELYRIAGEEGLNISPVDFSTDVSISNFTYSYRVLFNNSVEVTIYWKLEPRGFVLIGKRGGAVLYRVWRLEYYHVYRAPQWGEIRVYPTIWDPRGKVEVIHLDRGNWRVLVPVGVDKVFLEDEYGVRIGVGA